MRNRYEQYCPVAHALSLVGERWALLVVLELLDGPKRYTDLVERLPGIGTNILASRLRDLEAAGIVEKRILPPPAASRVYELTEHGRGLKRTIRELALWGARSLGPPTAQDEPPKGWLQHAVDIVLAPSAPPGRFEFRCGDELASLVDGQTVSEPIGEPDVVVTADHEGIYYLLVDGRLNGVEVEGDRDLLERLLQAVAPTVPLPA